MDINFLFIFVSALIPLLIGAVWYSDAVFGKAWFKASGMTEEKMKGGNMILIFALTYFFSLMLSMAMSNWSIHQLSTKSLFATQEGFADGTGQYFDYWQNFKATYWHLHRSFGHGAAHGMVASLLIVLPLISIISLFERRGWKYILIHWGYWTICLILMCGVLCKFA